MNERSGGIKPVPTARAGRLALALFVGGWFALAPPPGARAQEGIYLLPGEPERGMKHFLNKGCVRCHALLGEGGQKAPDLGRTPSAHLSATQLVSMMWNHGPRMWDEMKTENIARPTFEAGEIEDLFAFLYSVRSLDPPGDAKKGKALLSSKGCIRCHRVAGEGGRIGPELTEEDWSANPLQWAQMMWNHAGPMEEAMKEERLPWPEFEGEEMVDVLSYIRSQSGAPSHARAYPRSADAAAGRALFDQKGCRKCHPVRGSGGTDAADLGRKATQIPRTLAQFAGLMWNHAPKMRRMMASRQIEPIVFSNKEMADLIAYLYAVRYFDESGDPVEGRRVFQVKGCTLCHSGGPSARGPDLSRWAGHVTPVMMARTVWNHGPEMRETMVDGRIPWPTFEGSQMADLMAYLNGDGGAAR